MSPGILPVNFSVLNKPAFTGGIASAVIAACLKE